MASAPTTEPHRMLPAPFPPDPHHKHKGPSLYSDKLKTNVTWDNRLKRNILEITLEKENDTFEELGAEVIARLFKTLGVNIERDVEGFYQKNKSIQLWLTQGIDLDKFCKSESIKVTNNVKTGFIRPAGKKEVTVTISGLDFNTPDTFVMEYLSKFGKVITTSVIYGKYNEGIFAGKYNGDRKYQVDFTKSNNSMGTFHIIDGSRVRVWYPGNKKTCGRCHMTAENCKGDAVAKSCEENDGVKIDLKAHMKNLWESIGFQPNDFQLTNLNDGDEDTMNDAPIKDAQKFSPNIAQPKPTEDDAKKYNGVSIKNFPKEVKKVDVIDFLRSKGLPMEFPQGNIQFGDHGNIELSSVPSKLCQVIINNIHFPETRKKFFNKPIYCRAIRDLTPEKPITHNTAANIHSSLKSTQNLSFSASDRIDGKESIDDFVFEENNINSKFFRGFGGDSSEDNVSEADTGENNSVDAFLEKKDTPRSNTKEKKKRSRGTPGELKKLEKKPKTL